jgi:hypothetical protein
VSGGGDGELGELRRELDRLREENARLSRLLDLRGQDTTPAAEQLAVPHSPGLVTMSGSSVDEKLALYADRFRARTDVYAIFWETIARASEAGSQRWPAVGTEGLTAVARAISR